MMCSVTFFRGILWIFVLLCQRMTTTAVPIKHRIIGGKNATQHDTRHQVSIRLLPNDLKDFGRGFHCGGSLIASNIVLTAAHCLFDRNQRQYRTDELRVVMGTLKLNTFTNDTVIATVIDIHVHEDYNPMTIENDIAVLTLNLTALTNTEVRFQNGTESYAEEDIIAPISMSRQNVPVNSRCQVSGWGVTRIRGPASNSLLIANVSVIPVEKCNSMLSYNGMIKDGMICAGQWNGGVDSCYGDSGGPLVCDDVLVGIVSFGQSCALPKLPGIYTDVNYHREWIMKHLSNNSCRHNISLSLISISIVLLLTRFSH